MTEYIDYNNICYFRYKLSDNTYTSTSLLFSTIKQEIYPGIDPLLSLIETVKTSQNYTNLFRAIKLERLRLTSNVSYFTYVKILTFVLTELRIILINKKIEAEKRDGILRISMTTIDQRILRFNDYTSLEIDDLDEIQLISNTINYSPYQVSPIYDKCMLERELKTYRLAISPIETILAHLIGGSLIRFNDYIYQYCGKDEDENRYWRADMNDFYFLVHEEVKEYCIFLFKTIYYDVFKDNNFRENWLECDIQILQLDCLQLLRNIYALSNDSKFVFNLVHTMEVSNKDKVNLIGYEKSSFIDFSDTLPYIFTDFDRNDLFLILNCLK